MAAAALDYARTRGWSVAIAIVDEAAQLAHFQRLEGAKAGSIETSIAKARSAALFNRPTKGLEDAVMGGRAVLMRLPQATPIQGGLPIRQDGALVGGIGVSGVLSPQDEEIAQAAIDALLR